MSESVSTPDEPDSDKPPHPVAGAWQKVKQDAARLVVVGTVTHQRSGHPDPTVVDLRFARPLKTNEQPWQREVIVGQAWMKVPTGWIDAAAVVAIKNSGTETVEVGLTDDSGNFPILLIPPKESWAWVPADLSSLVMRSRGDDCKVTVTMFSV